MSGPGVYRILHGKHSAGRGVDGRSVMVGGDTGITIFESPVDLSASNVGRSIKFEFLGPPGSVPNAFRPDIPKGEQSASAGTETGVAQA